MLAGGLLAVGLSACGSSNATSDGAAGGNANRIKVAAAESFWGSLAKQLGGERVQAVSIISNPEVDPHDYDATPQDSATIAQAQLVIVNGLGYDPWASKAIEANSSKTRQVIDVGELLGLKEGVNPHRWYSPSDVDKVITAITDKLKAIDSAEAGYFDAQKTDFIANELAQYNRLRTEVSQKYAGTRVGATESIFAPLASDLGLDLVTPERFLDAISEGQGPTAADKVVVDRQIADKQIKVLVFNEQNTTPDVQALVAAAKRQRIPVVAVTETPTPRDAPFQDWQASQLQALADALAQAPSEK